MFATTQTDLKDILLSEISQTERKNTAWYHISVKSKKKKKIVKEFLL